MIQTKLDGFSENIVEDNIEKLKELFPEIVMEDKIDFEKLKLLLGEDIDDSDERYEFTWPGKKEAIKEAQKQSTGTLRPCKEESKNWEETKNLYIEGDNLEVLKLLQKSYYGKIKCVYIDPPYNTGRDFVYNDNYKDNLKNYLELTSQKEGNMKLTTNNEFGGRFHTKWLNMMYPRLKLARNLLTDDGVIFISIDDNEVENLRKICDEIFGEDNFNRNVIWEKKYSPANDSKVISDNHDHILVYCKNINKWDMGLLPRTDEMNKRYINRDNDSRGPWKPGGLSAKTYNSKYDYDIKTPSGKIVKPPSGSCWQVSKDRLKELIDDNRIYWGKNNDSKPQLKQFLSEVQQGRVPKSIWNYEEVGHNQVSRKEITDIFGEFIFDTPKPTKLIEQIITISNLSYGDIVLDFFSGSSSTAHATMKYNQFNNTNLRFIMIQIPERCNIKSKDYDGKYENICKIGESRINLVGDKILEESKNKDLDIGFKLFKLDSSNLEKWDPDYSDLEQSLLVQNNNIKMDRSQEDLVYEIMLKYGIDLTTPIEEIKTPNNTIYSIGFGSILVCLDDKISSSLAKDIIKIKDDCGSVNTRVVLRDSALETDSDKTNIKEMLKVNKIEEFICI